MNSVHLKAASLGEDVYSHRSFSFGFVRRVFYQNAPIGTTGGRSHIVPPRVRMWHPDYMSSIDRLPQEISIDLKDGFFARNASVFRPRSAESKREASRLIS